MNNEVNVKKKDFDVGSTSVVQPTQALVVRVGPQCKTTSSTASLPPGLLPKFNEADPIRFYSEVWDWSYLPSIASALHTDNGVGLLDTPLLVEMMTAISASHLSRTSPQRRLLMPSSTPGLSHRPDPAHEIASRSFYGIVMRKLTQWSERDFGTNPIMGLTVLTLMCLIESSMGSFQAFELHSSGITKFIQNYAQQALVPDSRARNLLQPLVEVRMQMWWRRVYFGTPDFHRNRPMVSLGPGLENLSILKSRRAAILLILCESHRINNAAVIASWDSYVIRPLETPLTHDQSDIDQCGSSSYLEKLGKQSEYLEVWRQGHALSGVLDESENSSDFRKPATHVEPLRMETHADAMDLAYYIASRVLQSSGPLTSLFALDADEIREGYKEVEAWANLLLRVVAGMSWNECVQLNIYTIGITGLLLACLLRTHDPRIGIWLEEWLQGCLDGSTFEEGSFPAFQALDIIKLVNRERSQGRDVISLFQTVEDGGGSGKFGSYQSQALTCLLVYSRCRLTGRLYSDYKSI